MSVALLMKRGLGSHLSLMVLVTALGVAPTVSAVVPVVEPRPDASVVSNIKSAAVPELAGVTEQANSGGETAHLLNVLEQLRNDVMDLRGQVEEQAHLLKQLQQESRDRYMDLDKRLSLLSGNGVASGERKAPVAGSNSVSSKNNLASGADVSPEKAIYDQAFSLIQEKRFDDALRVLKKQLADYPDGAYAANAQYWLGEVQMAQAQYEQAEASFSAVLKNFPDSQKVPDATYKLGRLADILGNKQKARDLLKSVIEKYPDSSASRLSDTYLRQLGES